MKQKKWSPKNIALLVAVGLVWCFVGYRAYEYFFGSNEEVVEEANTAQAAKVDITSQKMEAYALLEEPYRDPFLGKAPRRPYVRPSYNPGQQGNVQPNPRNNVNNRRLVGQQNQPIPEGVTWPPIVYKGLVENPGNDRKAILLNISGRDNFYLEGEQLNGIKLVKMMGDSVRLAFGGEQRVFQK